ncbi:hypothetical protein AFEL58S_01980 [Afipia felis]
MSRRGPRRATITFEQLLASSELLRKQHALWTDIGYGVTSARLWRCRDGSYTARVVWRDRAAIVSTFTCTVQGVILA